ncbi:hypothetical protein [Actinoallomurus rhizosphaericola]|uniref:hypothetical protein n=1 Tax=Actinoallomurus rhizosphaericola TaxID=2952536 RepID=UPI002091FBDA|nr:hypothetical protein [Actinoallomurus rhizosphaericola]MCO5995749.1 hypothetical protein [Actinoallomurus rhizosphaericola]
MADKIGSVTQHRFDDLVDQASDMMQTMTGQQFAIGDMALEIEPMRHTHTGHDEGIHDSLRRFADEIGEVRWSGVRRVSSSTLRGVKHEQYREGFPGAGASVESPGAPYRRRHAIERRISVTCPCVWPYPSVRGWVLGGCSYVAVRSGRTRYYVGRCAGK